MSDQKTKQMSQPHDIINAVMRFSYKLILLAPNLPLIQLSAVSVVEGAYYVNAIREC